MGTCVAEARTRPLRGEKREFLSVRCLAPPVEPDGAVCATLPACFSQVVYFNCGVFVFSLGARQDGSAFADVKSSI